MSEVPHRQQRFDELDRRQVELMASERVRRVRIDREMAEAELGLLRFELVRRAVSLGLSVLLALVVATSAVLTWC